MTKNEREKLIQALANLDEIVHAIGYKKMRAAGAATSWHKVYEIINGMIKPGEGTKHGSDGRKQKAD